MTIPCAIYTDLTTKEDFVTDVIIFNQLKYICVATNFGNIKVFKWDSKKQTKKIIQTLKGHTRAISSMMYIPPRKVKRSQLNNKAAFVDDVLQD
jgi:WD40 repeat protein